MTVIVTDTEYRMSLAVIRDLSEYGIRVVGCNSSSSNTSSSTNSSANLHKNPGIPLGFHSKYMDEFYIFPEDEYINRLHSLCGEIYKNEKIKPVIIPAGAKTLYSLTLRKSEFEGVCGLLIPTTNQLNLLNDKSGLSSLADELGIQVPKTYSMNSNENLSDFANRIPLPCVVKPTFGEGLGLSAKDRYRIPKTCEELISCYKHFEALDKYPPLVQEYLPGNSTGCSVLCENGKIIHNISHLRLREYPISGGPSTCAQTINRPDLLKLALKIVEHISFSGIAMFEFKDDINGISKLLEANPRVWGTYPLTRVSKSNFTLLWYLLAFNRANPNQAVPLPQSSPFHPKTMIYSSSDLAAAVHYLKSKKLKRAAGAFIAPFLPSVKDGIWEWSDPKPALTYYKSLFRRRK